MTPTADPTPSPPPRLSICIPVFNFGAFVGATLASVLPQAGAEVEVLVVDGASTDDTEAVVRSLAAEWPRLRYVRLEARGGIDADMAASIELARGEYCWLFSGDDIMRPGAVERLLEWLHEGHDVYVCLHSICDKNMKFVGDYPIFTRSSGPRRIDMGQRAARQTYLADAVNTEALFSFMSGLTVRRETWRSIPPVSKFMGSCWGHVARLLTIAAQRGRLSVCYVDEVWLDKRSENDSFSDRGVVHRIGIGVDGFVSIADHFFGPASPERHAVLRMLRNELSVQFFAQALVLAHRNPSRESEAELRRMFALLYGPWRPLAPKAYAIRATEKARRVLGFLRRRAIALTRRSW